MNLLDETKSTRAAPITTVDLAQKVMEKNNIRQRDREWKRAPAFAEPTKWTNELIEFHLNIKLRFIYAISST